MTNKDLPFYTVAIVLVALVGAMIFGQLVRAEIDFNAAKAFVDSETIK